MRICVEGLDCSGKTTVAKYLSERLGLEYVKLRKQVSAGLTSQQEITQAIVDGVARHCAESDGFVLDRGRLSAVATGIVFDSSLDHRSILASYPAAAVPELELLVLSSPAAIYARTDREFTAQDRRVLSADYLGLQELMVRYALRPVIVRNEARTSAELYAQLDGVLQSLQGVALGSRFERGAPEGASR